MNEFFKYFLPQVLDYFGDNEEILKYFIPEVIKKMNIFEEK